MMIASSESLPGLFAESEVPTGPITTEAADVLAAILWEAAGQCDGAQDDDPEG